MKKEKTPSTVPTLSFGVDIYSTFRKGPLVVVLYGDELGKKFYLEKGKNLFGRSLNCDHVIDNASVSRRHFIIHYDNDNFYLKDLGSTNGTFVNGIRVKDTVKLTSTDLISVGNVILKFLVKEDTDQFFNKEFYKLSTIDPLTDAYNKQYFIDVLSKELDRSLRYERALSLILLDVDHFKEVNEKYGYPVGDSILRGLSSFLMGKLRKQDVLARYHEDCFGIILPETPLEKAVVVGERIRKSIHENKFFINSENFLRITVSIGIASISDETASVMTLLKKVDDNLYLAKKEGGNKVKY